MRLTPAPLTHFGFVNEEGLGGGVPEPIGAGMLELRRKLFGVTLLTGAALVIVQDAERKPTNGGETSHLECADLALLGTARPDARGNRNPLLCQPTTVPPIRRVVDRSYNLGPTFTRARSRWLQRCQVSALQNGPRRHIHQSWHPQVPFRAINLAGENLTRLYRPVGQSELDLIQASGRIPPRLPIQPIFYPVLTREYAEKIARDWNTKDVASQNVGYVTNFLVKTECLSRFEVQTVGGKAYQEYWIPADELDEFNENIVGGVDVLSEHRRQEAIITT